MRRYPHLYEIHARLFLRRMSPGQGRALTLAKVPEAAWQVFTRRGFDLVWLMGVWQRSAGARQEALHHEGLRREYGRALPGWTDEDIAGSPYAVYAYELDSSLGKPSELGQLRKKLNRLGLGLILDFIPNHVALDHPWTLSHPKWFVPGKAEDARAHPEAFYITKKGACLAHGRDPNFPPWTDTAQMNFFSADLRQALTKELLRIAEVADGVRCDMAMLVLNDVFQRTWGGQAGYPRPDTEFWGEAIARVKRSRPGFLFLAEAYWGLEPQLQKLGFDFTYDKAFYDRLRSSGAYDIRQYLAGPYRHPVRFIENHDEERAINAFGRERSLAAAAILGTVPGLRLFHDGQIEGRRIRLPVQLLRPPQEADDSDVGHFYERLLEVCNLPVFHEGEWELMDAGRGQHDDSHLNILAWCWRLAGGCKIVVVNYSAQPARARLKLPQDAAGDGLTLRDELSGRTYKTSNDPPGGRGLDLELKPWEALVLDMAPRNGRAENTGNITEPLKEVAKMVKMTKSDAGVRLGDVAQDKRFWCHDGRHLKNLEELKTALEQMTDETFRYHSNEAKSDFSNWVRDVIGDDKLARDLYRSTTQAEAARRVADRINWLKSK